MIVEQTVRLTFPQRLLDQPLLYGLIRQYDVQTNILEAQVGNTEGWLVLAVRGDELRLLHGLDWLRQQGVQVEVLNKLEEER
jgi:ABC-type methionine transport system ATPase subunit